jgi:hypothetical protein
VVPCRGTCKARVFTAAPLVYDRPSLATHTGARPINSAWK